VLLKGQFKLFSARSVKYACWHSPLYPNATLYNVTKGRHTYENVPDCNSTEVSLNPNGGLLFDIFADPSEYTDLSADPQHADTLKQMQDRIAVLDATIFRPTRGGGDEDQAAAAARDLHRGFWGPFVFP
jgi:hypothetical protein